MGSCSGKTDEVAPNPNLSRENYVIGLHFQAKKDFVVAHRHLALAVKHNPRSADAHAALGHLLHKEMNNALFARRHFEIAMSLDPSNEIAQVSLGFILMGKVGAPTFKTHLVDIPPVSGPSEPLPATSNDVEF